MLGRDGGPRCGIEGAEECGNAGGAAGGRGGPDGGGRRGCGPFDVCERGGMMPGMGGGGGIDGREDEPS